MSDRPAIASRAGGSRYNLTARFADECGLRGPLRFMVENTESGQSQTFDVFEPFVLIGRANGCHLQLLHPDVSFRHAYCQVVEGRLYVFDLDSVDGIAWGAGLRREGPLTPETRLQIGPFVIRQSRAPAFTRSLEPTAEDWMLENEPTEDAGLWFDNATGRSSHSAMRPLRRRITIMGRANCCHLKLSDASVSKAHCAVVATDGGYWVVDLLGRNGTTVNEQNVRFAPIETVDLIGVGRFRLRVRRIFGDRDDHVVHQQPSYEPAPDSEFDFPVVETRGPILPAAQHPTGPIALEDLEHAQQELTRHASKLPAGVAGGDARASDPLILAMMEQFSHLQQQLLSHTQQQMSMLTDMFATLHKAQNDAVMEQLHRIQSITSELNELRAERGVSESSASARHRTPPSSASSGGHVADSTADHSSSAPALTSSTPGIDSGADDVDTIREVVSEVGGPVSSRAETKRFVARNTVAGELENAEDVRASDCGDGASDEFDPSNDVSSLESDPRHGNDDRISEANPSGVAESIRGHSPSSESNFASMDDDSDVVPVGLGAEEAEEDRQAAVDQAYDDAASESPSLQDQALTRERSPRNPERVARHDPAAHARLTMRISELERERKSRWKRLMDLVGGAADE